jgi:hypothetical protein
LSDQIGGEFSQALSGGLAELGDLARDMQRAGQGLGVGIEHLVANVDIGNPLEVAQAQLAQAAEAVGGVCRPLAFVCVGGGYSSMHTKRPCARTGLSLLLSSTLHDSC